MVAVADTFASSTSRRLLLRARPDLAFKRHRYHGRTYWVVKDPIALQYFRFQEEEYALLRWLDGRTSLDELKRRFEAEFRPQKIRVEELQQFVGMLHKSGLILSDAAGQGRQLWLRRRERTWKEWGGRLANLLAIRFRGIDPEPVLNWLYPKVRWCFTLPALVAALLLGLAAVLLVTVQFDVFQSKLPSFHQFFTAQNMIWMMLVLALTKVLHEFGHGLMCKHFGGECHEMGVMLLVLTPCLYCNVSDSWMLPNKWQRAAIGAAGMYFELVLASLATFVWWFTEPGLLHHLALSTMFVSSVSTVVFNSNPLLRYDGYYILSDVLEIPNLSQKANQALEHALSTVCLGTEPQEHPFLPERRRGLFALYAVASFAYRWFVMLSILLFLNSFLEPYKLKIVGQLLGVIAIGGLLVQPAIKVGRFFWVPGRTDQVKRARVLISLGVLAALVAVVCLLPIPHRVYSSLEVHPRGAQPIYAAAEARLEELLVEPGQRVARGDVLMRLSSADLDLEIAKLAGQRDEYLARLDSLRVQRFRDPAAQLQTPYIQESLAAVEDQLRQKQSDRERLIVTAPVDGTVLPPPLVPEPPPSDEQLHTWYGSPLSRRNLGAKFDKGTMLCQIGDPRQFEAILVIDQADIEFVDLNQDVAIKLDELPWETFRGRIREVARQEMRVSPQKLSNKSGGDLATKTDEAGIERPQSTSYQARVFPLDDPHERLRMGLLGRARIGVGWQTLGGWAWREFTRTFHFRL